MLASGSPFFHIFQELGYQVLLQTHCFFFWGRFNLKIESSGGTLSKCFGLFAESLSAPGITAKASRSKSYLKNQFPSVCYF